MATNETEILSAEVFLQSFEQHVDTAAIDARMAQINDALRAYDCEASLEDYAAAVLCGILSGGVDCLLRNNEIDPNKPVMHIPHARIEKGLLSRFSDIDKTAKSGTVAGLVAMLFLQLSNSGILSKKDGKLSPLPDGIEGSDGVWLVGTGVVVGAIKWLTGVNIPEAEAKTHLKGLNNLRQLARSRPEIAEIIHGIDKWQSRLAGEMKGHRQVTKSEMGVRDIFASMLTALAALPFMQQTNLSKAMSMMNSARQIGLPNIPTLQALAQQSLSVVFNEILVRSVYFVSRLLRELSAHEDVNDVDWCRVVPANNIVLDRMIAFSSSTAAIANTTAAAVQAIIESNGNMAIFGVMLMKRINFAGAAHALVSVYKVIDVEKEKADLIHERRLLMEEKASITAEQLQAYRQMVEERVSEYIAEDISAFLMGFEQMDRGLASGDSDLVIKGNVVIQRVLGREPQFTNQAEFDDLMDSDVPLQL